MSRSHRGTVRNSKVKTQHPPAAATIESRDQMIKDKNEFLDPTPWGPYIASSQRNQQRSPLLRLPPEVRTNIYHHLYAGLALSIFRDDEFRNPSGARRPAWRFQIDVPTRPSRFSLAVLHVCRLTYAEARLVPFAEAHVCLLYFTAQDPIVQRIHQRYALREATLRRAASSYAYPGCPPSPPVRVLPVQTNAITSIEVLNRVRPTFSALMKDVACLPALKQIFWPLRPHERAFDRRVELDIRRVVAVQEAVGERIRVIVEVPAGLIWSLKGELDEEAWTLWKEAFEQRFGGAHVVWLER